MVVEKSWELEKDVIRGRLYSRISFFVSLRVSTDVCPDLESAAAAPLSAVEGNTDLAAHLCVSLEIILNNLSEKFDFLRPHLFGVDLQTFIDLIFPNYRARDCDFSSRIRPSTVDQASSFLTATGDTRNLASP